MTAGRNGRKAPDLMGEMKTKPRRGRPPKVKIEPSQTAEQIAASMEKEGRFWLEQAKVLRGKAKAK